MSRPSFNAAWAASQRIYDPANPGAKVAKVIGGNVEKNINNPVPAQRWDNTCAVRMSYIQALVDSYLARDYSNPLVEPEIKGVRFDFLKCMDLVKRLVIDPKRSYRR